MKTAIRIMLTLFAVVASYIFVYWVPFSLIPGAHKIELIPNAISLLIAILIGIFLWKKTGNISNSLSSYILAGGIIIGAIGFILGFFGPIILNPTANQGPLLGIFITGPIGFIFGLFGGGLYWKIKVKNK
jgi:uncharacterized YccA/Bax inhibitor family protein